MSVLHVRHIQEALTGEFDGLIDLSDVAVNAQESQRGVQFLTRALAAFTVRHLTGCSSVDAAAAVIDGRDDHGIDAIAVDEAEPHLWLIQTKWSQQGVAGFDLGAALKLVQGLDLLLNAKYSRFNSRFQAISDKVDRVLRDTGVKITLVPALLGDASVSNEVRQPMADVAQKLNSFGDEMLDIKVLGLRDFHRLIRADSAPPHVELSVTLDGCGWLTNPYTAYYGVMPVEKVARWHETYGDRLFDQNIRKSLGLTKVNRELIDTLCERPDDFWYFNNGITVLCERIRATPRGGTSPNGSRDIVLEGASVVNGAQTVAAIAEALRRKPDVAGEAQIWVRVISLENCPEGFSGEVTGATNTQNRVEKRDLAALDPVQIELRDEFAWALGKAYVIKRGEDEPNRETGCTNLEAAEALACAHSNARLAVQARLGGESLWETGPGSAYVLLFGKKPSAHRVWRSVLLRREVERYLAESADEREGRGAAIASQCGHLLAHAVFQHLNHGQIDHPGATWEEAVLSRVPLVSERALRWMIHALDDEFGQNSYVISVFKNPEKSQILVKRVLLGLSSGEIPELAPEYVPAPAVRGSKKGKAVSILVEAGVLEEGTPLEFRPITGEERHLMTPWLAQDPRRGRVTWVNSKSKPLLWEADGQQYSPTGLVQHMREQALGKENSVQGTRYWFLSGQGSLVELAEFARDGEKS
ncbi:AIPR family protein [Planomonospora algeriensis]